MFEHPGIAEHYAFLQRRVTPGGVLAAAGPLPDEPGNGMTVLAVPDLDTANRLATQDDQAVVNGILEVQVRPWHATWRAATARCGGVPPHCAPEAWPLGRVAALLRAALL